MSTLGNHKTLLKKCLSMSFLESACNKSFNFAHKLLYAGKRFETLFLKHFWRQLTVGVIHTVKKPEAQLHLWLRSSHKLTFGQPPLIYFPIITQWFLTVSVCRGFIPFFQIHILIFNTSKREFGRKCRNPTSLFTREKKNLFFFKLNCETNSSFYIRNHSESVTVFSSQLALSKTAQFRESKYTPLISYTFILINICLWKDNYCDLKNLQMTRDRGRA